MRIHSFGIFEYMKWLMSLFILFLGVNLSACLDREKEYGLLDGRSYIIKGRFTKNCDGEAVVNQKLQLVSSNYRRETGTKIFASTVTDPNGNFEMWYADPFQFTTNNVHSFIIQKEVSKGQFVNQSVQLRPYDNLKVNLIDSAICRIHLAFVGADSLTSTDTLFFKLIHLTRNFKEVNRILKGPFRNGDFAELVYYNMDGYNYFTWAIGDTNFNLPFGTVRYHGNFEQGEILLQFCGEDTLQVDLNNIKR